MWKEQECRRKLLGYVRILAVLMCVFLLFIALIYRIIMNRSLNTNPSDIAPDFASRKNIENDKPSDRMTAGLFNYYVDKLTKLAMVYG